MLVDPIVGGVVSTIGNVASSLLGGSSASRNQRQMMEYNSPVNQVRRLRQAGLNPALAMTNGMMDSAILARVFINSARSRINCVLLRIRCASVLASVLAT